MEDHRGERETRDGAPAGGAVTLTGWLVVSLVVVGLAGLWAYTRTRGGRRPDRKDLVRRAWLVCNGRQVAPLEIADSALTAARGLLGRDGIDGAMLLRGGKAGVHTLGMRFALDVAYCDRNLRVLRTVRMAPNRVGAPLLSARWVLEAEAGAFSDWGVYVGAQLQIGADQDENTGTDRERGTGRESGKDRGIGTDGEGGTGGTIGKDHRTSTDRDEEIGRR